MKLYISKIGVVMFPSYKVDRTPDTDTLVRRTNWISVKVVRSVFQLSILLWAILGYSPLYFLLYFIHIPLETSDVEFFLMLWFVIWFNITYVAGLFGAKNTGAVRLVRRHLSIMRPTADASSQTSEQMYLSVDGQQLQIPASPVMFT